ncbi:MAG: hypothetical protein JNJ54_12070 [Myxococcaceae bacterium]|nr:hypothetical protein [Myxococcaceae bacterium]
MTTLHELRTLPARELERLLADGHPIDPSSLEGWAFRGTVLATPRLVQRLTWTTFQKTFHRLADGRLVGWNVRLEQTGLDGPSRPLLDGGVPRCVWPYEVLPCGQPGFERGLVIDYAPFAGALDTMRFVKDPLVAVDEGGELLLGVSYAVLGARRVPTPTWFALHRDQPISYVPPLFEPAPALREFERRWADALFEGLLGTPLPKHERFWQLIAAHAPALVKPGLRVAVHALTMLPLSMGFGRPFFALDAQSRVTCAEAMAAHPSLTVKQLVSTLKVLACFALLESEGVRAGLVRAGTAAAPASPDDGRGNGAVESTQGVRAAAPPATPTAATSAAASPATARLHSPGGAP